ncbi:molybdopterin synthase catalytic subunit [Maniola hyperantus]|uniref:molybdopterin synthase catalytic subunit n=1 Tax=Aphantopus hyperantus TaxID=2795564 RepID=UPI00156960DD|nr:molybdopterin synthase catalytic subunit [Maniola hyperantus]
MDHLKLTPDKLSVEEVSDLVLDSRCGAVSVFVGITRDSFDGKKVVRLEYEAYDSMALKAMQSICDDVRDKWPDLHNIAMYHRLGCVPVKEASVVIAVSSPHRVDSLEAVSYCIDQLKASVPIWKKEVYEDQQPVWKENKECLSMEHTKIPESPIDKNLVQINVSNEELDKRIQNFIERKREQINISNIQDFIPSKGENETEDMETCARVRTQFVRRSDSKGHLKIRRVYNEWGPQTVSRNHPYIKEENTHNLPSSIAERVLAIESFLNTGPVAPDIYRRLKEMEDKIAYLQSISPEYSMFWKNKKVETDDDQEAAAEYTFTAEDITKRIELLEKQQ